MMSALYLQDFHTYDNHFSYDDYSFSKEELDEALDEFLYPKPSKQTFCQILINIVTISFHCDD